MKINNLIQQQNELTAEELILKSYEIFRDKIIATSSFGTTSGVLIHLLSTLKIPVKIVYVNTGFLFKETIDYIDKLKILYNNLEFVELHPALSREEFIKTYGNNIININPDFCCKINKVEPLKNYLDEQKIQAWFSGLRSEQTEFRKKLKRITLLKNGVYKILPILNWTEKEVYYYMKDNGIPFHPLYEKGYTSIGCEPCTELPDSDDERSGRWKGKKKKECGLHTKI